MNEGKLDVIKQEIAKLNILGLLETSDRTGKGQENGQERVNLIKIIIRFTTGKNPLEEME